MTRMILISLPVTDLSKSKVFYEALGFIPNAAFSSETSAYLVWSEAIRLMLLTQEAWRNLTTRPIPPSTHSEVGFQLSLEDRNAVDVMVAAVAARGGTVDVNPIEDHDFVYTRDLADPDGHIWGVTWMDPAMTPLIA